MSYPRVFDELCPVLLVPGHCGPFPVDLNAVDGAGRVEGIQARGQVGKTVLESKGKNVLWFWKLHNHFFLFLQSFPNPPKSNKLAGVKVKPFSLVTFNCE